MPDEKKDASPDPNEEKPRGPESEGEEKKTAAAPPVQSAGRETPQDAGAEGTKTVPPAPKAVEKPGPPKAAPAATPGAPAKPPAPARNRRGLRYWPGVRGVGTGHRPKPRFRKPIAGYCRAYGK